MNSPFLCLCESLLSLTHTVAADYLKSFSYPWQALPGLREQIIKLGKSLDKNEYKEISESVWLHKTAKIAPTAYIGSPCIIGANTEVRHCAFIRGSALIGENCAVGNSTELKNVILFDSVQVPHYNYVGDSILGYKAHMGAGAITSNVKSDKSPVTVNYNGKTIETGLKKFGAIVGDCAEIGCNSVLNPGTVIGKSSTIYPLTSVRGVIPPGCIVKSGMLKIVLKEER